MIQLILLLKEYMFWQEYNYRPAAFSFRRTRMMVSSQTRLLEPRLDLAMETEEWVQTP